MHRTSLGKLFWIRRIDLVMTELAEAQRSGFRNEDGLDVGEGTQGRKCIIRGGGKWEGFHLHDGSGVPSVGLKASCEMAG